MPSEPIRVTHLFSTRLGREFSGDLKSWVRRLKAWSHPDVVHQVLSPRGVMQTPMHDFLSAISQQKWPDSRFRRALLVGSRIVADRSRLDVLHIHIPTWAGLLAAPVCRVAGRPSLFELTLQDSDNPSAIRAERFGGLKLACFKENRAFLCISKALSDDCVRMGIDERAVHLLPSPVDTNTFCPADLSRSELRAKYGYPTDAFLMLCVASVIHRKGIDVLVEAMKRVREYMSSPFLVVVGPDSSSTSPGVDDAFVETVMDEVHSSGLESAIRFTGQVDDDQALVDHYRMADVSVLPSRAEGLGHVIIESMSTGTPVVASLLPGVTDTAIEHEVNGFLVPPEDVEGFAARLSWIEQHPGEVRSMGERARSKVVRSFGLKAWEDKLAEFYQSLLR